MKIGQLAKAVDCTVETIRFYEKQGLLPAPERTSGGFRLYQNEHFRRLSFICYCRSLDISLPEIKLLLEAENSSEQQAQELNALLDKHIQDISKRIHELDHLWVELVRIKKKCSELTGSNLIQEVFSKGNVRFRPLSK